MFFNTPRGGTGSALVQRDVCSCQKLPLAKNASLLTAQGLWQNVVSPLRTEEFQSSTTSVLRRSSYS